MDLNDIKQQTNREIRIFTNKTWNDIYMVGYAEGPRHEANRVFGTSIASGIVVNVCNMISSQVYNDYTIRASFQEKLSGEGMDNNVL